MHRAGLKYFPIFSLSVPKRETFHHLYKQLSKEEILEFQAIKFSNLGFNLIYDWKLRNFD